MLEFIPYSHIRSLAQAIALLADVGQEIRELTVLVGDPRMPACWWMPCI